MGFASDYRSRQLILNSQPNLVGRVAYGVAQYAWDEGSQTLKRTWMNPDVSCASSIPTVSAHKDTPYAYCIGRRGPPVHPVPIRTCPSEVLPNFMTRWLNINVANTSTCGTWTLEALNWETGASEFHIDLGEDYRFNPFYAATEIGPDGDIYAGTLGGFVRIFYGRDRTFEIIGLVLAGLLTMGLLGACGYKWCLCCGVSRARSAKPRASQEDEDTEDTSVSDSA